MRGKLRWGLIVLAAVTAVWLVADDSGALAAESSRTETWEFTVPVRYFTGDTLEFDHGSTVELNDDLGMGFGFGYNMSEHINLNFEFGWTDANYKVNFASADVPPGPSASASGTLEASSGQFNFTYNFMAKTFTPYISAGLGWTWIDSNIPSGPPQTGCWWDPWYGYICTTYQYTYTETGFTYGIGAGVRFDPKESFFLRVGLNNNWQDIGNSASTPDLLSYRIEMGWKF